MPNTANSDWDEASPAITDPRRDGAEEIRVLRGGVADRLSKEHTEPATAGVGGEHREGSARAYHQSSAPTHNPDGSVALGASDDGRFWVDSDDGVLYYWNGTAWTAVNATGGSAVTPTKYCRVNQAAYTHLVAGSFVNILTSLSEASGQSSDFETLQADGIDLQTGTYIIEAFWHTTGAGSYLVDAKLVFSSGTVTPSAGVSMIGSTDTPFPKGFYKIRTRFNVTVAGRLQFQVKVNNTGIVVDSTQIHIEKLS